MRGPDVVFISHGNLPDVDPDEAYWPGAPDFAVEVRSPDDRSGEVDEKTKAWLDAGVQLLWIVNPKLRNVTVFRSLADVLV